MRISLSERLFSCFTLWHIFVFTLIVKIYFLIKIWSLLQTLSYFLYTFASSLHFYRALMVCKPVSHFFQPSGQCHDYFHHLIFKKNKQIWMIGDLPKVHTEIQVL